MEVLKNTNYAKNDMGITNSFSIFPYLDEEALLFLQKPFIKKYLLQFINDWNRDLLEMMGNERRLEIQYFFETRNINSFSSLFSHLEKDGITKRNNNNHGSRFDEHSFFDESKRLYFHTNFNLKDKETTSDFVYKNLSWNTLKTFPLKFYEKDHKTLSFWRSEIRNTSRHFSKQSFFEKIIFFDKFGDEMLQFNKETKNNIEKIHNIIPRNFSNLYDARIKREAFILTLKNFFDEQMDVFIQKSEKLKDFQNENYNYFESRRSFISFLLSVRHYYSEKTAKIILNKLMNSICEKIKESQMKSKENNDTVLESSEYYNYLFRNIGQLIHVWEYSIEISLLSKVLTEKAFEVAILENSLNKVSDFVKLIKGSINSLNSLKKQKNDFKKETMVSLRKRSSSAIKKYKNFEMATEHCREINKTIDKILSKKMNISKKLFNKIELFISEMQKYASNISVESFVSFMGKANAKKIAEGSYEGLFEERLFNPSYSLLGEFLKDKLKEMGKSGRKLYGKLNKEFSMDRIMSGNITENEYLIILSHMKQSRMEIPEYLSKLNLYTAKIEKKCSPEYLVAGDATVCCMSYGSNKARDYALEKGFGVFNIYYKNKIIANSVLWIEEELNCLVFDNVEVHPNYNKNHTLLRKLYDRCLASVKQDYGVEFSIQGGSYNDMVLFNKDSAKNICDEISCKKQNAKDVICDDFYSDAKYSAYIVDEKEKDYVSFVKEIIEKCKQKAKEKAEQLLQGTTKVTEVETSRTYFREEGIVNPVPVAVATTNHNAGNAGWMSDDVDFDDGPF